MTPTQAFELVDRLRDNWDSPTWSQGRYDLFVDALAPVPYAIAAPAVRELVLRGLPRGEFRIRVEHLTAAIDKHLDRRRALEQQRLDRLAIAGPKDPEVGKLLRATIVKLEARLAGPAATRQHSAGERGRGQAARRRAGGALR